MLRVCGVLDRPVDTCDHGGQVRDAGRAGDLHGNEPCAGRLPRICAA